MSTRKLYKVRRERLERVEWYVRIWADSIEDAMRIGAEIESAPGAYLDDRVISTLERGAMEAEEVTDPHTLHAYREDVELP